MAFNVKWTRTATLDLEAIVDYIAEDDIGTALSILSRLEQTAAGLIRLPRRGRVVPELADYGIQIYRELVCSPWRIIYRISEKRVKVLAVLDSRRNLEDVLLERLVR